MLLKREGEKGSSDCERCIWKLKEFNSYKEILELKYLYFINNFDREERSHLINLPVVIKL